MRRAISIGQLSIMTIIVNSGSTLTITQPSGLTLTADSIIAALGVLNGAGHHQRPVRADQRRNDREVPPASALEIDSAALPQQRRRDDGARGYDGSDRQFGRGVEFLQWHADRRGLERDQQLPPCCSKRAIDHRRRREYRVRVGIVLATTSTFNSGSNGDQPITEHAEPISVSRAHSVMTLTSRGRYLDRSRLMAA